MVATVLIEGFVGSTDLRAIPSGEPPKYFHRRGKSDGEMLCSNDPIVSSSSTHNAWCARTPFAEWSAASSSCNDIAASKAAVHFTPGTLSFKESATCLLDDEDLMVCFRQRRTVRTCPHDFTCREPAPEESPAGSSSPAPSLGTPEFVLPSAPEPALEPSPDIQGTRRVAKQESQVISDCRDGLLENSGHAINPLFRWTHDHGLETAELQTPEEPSDISLGLIDAQLTFEAFSPILKWAYDDSPCMLDIQITEAPAPCGPVEMTTALPVYDHGAAFMHAPSPRHPVCWDVLRSPSLDDKCLHALTDDLQPQRIADLSDALSQPFVYLNTDMSLDPEDQPLHVAYSRVSDRELEMQRTMELISAVRSGVSWDQAIKAP